MKIDLEKKYSHLAHCLWFAVQVFLYVFLGLSAIVGVILIGTFVSTNYPPAVMVLYVICMASLFITVVASVVKWFDV